MKNRSFLLLDVTRSRILTPRTHIPLKSPACTLATYYVTPSHCTLAKRHTTTTARVGSVHVLNSLVGRALKCAHLSFVVRCLFVGCWFGAGSERRTREERKTNESLRNDTMGANGRAAARAPTYYCHWQRTVSHIFIFLHFCVRFDEPSFHNSSGIIKNARASSVTSQPPANLFANVRQECVLVRVQVVLVVAERRFI